MQHFDDDGWHLYCVDDVACKARAVERRAAAEAALTERRAAAERARIEVEAQSAAYDAIRAELTVGLVPLDSACERVDFVAELATKKSVYDFRLVRATVRGYAVVVEYAHSYDDDRTTLWAPRTLADELLDEAAMRIPMHVAKDWLRDYRGCFGTEMYEYAAQRGE
jgi:hypothetical protein